MQRLVAEVTCHLFLEGGQFEHQGTLFPVLGAGPTAGAAPARLDRRRDGWVIGEPLDEFASGLIQRVESWSAVAGGDA